jgi:hypothetical protein
MTNYSIKLALNDGQRHSRGTYLLRMLKQSGSLQFSDSWNYISDSLAHVTPGSGMPNFTWKLES